MGVEKNGNGMTGKLADLAEQVLDAAAKAGADSADALLVEGTSVSIEVRAGALEHAERSEGIDLGVRVLVGARQACVSISDESPASIAVMAERAVAMARPPATDSAVSTSNPRFSMALAKRFRNGSSSSKIIKELSSPISLNSMSDIVRPFF